MRFCALLTMHKELHQVLHQHGTRLKASSAWPEHVVSVNTLMGVKLAMPAKHLLNIYMMLN